MINCFQKSKNNLPYSVWTVEQLKHLEYECTQSLGIDLYELMLRAGYVVYEHICMHWPDANNWLILCGHGNNGGDGYIVARLAKLSGKRVTLIACNDNKTLSILAKKASNSWLEVNGVINPSDMIWPKKIDIIIDALLGTGNKLRPLQQSYLKLIKLANINTAPIVSIDIPSGLLANNGNTTGETIYATHTLSLITLKPGQLIGRAKEFIGKLYCNDLGLSSFLSTKKPPIYRFDASCLINWLQPRNPISHKGNHGRILVIGGNVGTVGAVYMAGEAALRSGSGLVKILIHPNNVVSTVNTRPELMVKVLSIKSIDYELDWADVVIIGPGLGLDEWSKKIIQMISSSNKPMLWDADALNLLAINENKNNNRIITPHLKEASRLLNINIEEITNNLLLAANNLVKKYGGIVVLKSAVTIITNGKDIACIDVGNAGMASGGMGDVLSGIIASFVGQNLTLFNAAAAGCVVHGAAADEIALKYGERGMLAMDLMKFLWKYVNPKA
ncbi:MAG: bifunctional ADP-dependent NAD(P)H-hydrate dehydratase/NAD(P)H-hydrate epimerase [Pantoea sp. Brub]|nr:bifunctional ADP-dependent NAD(P)H-hydrate dehydratase/NAD(P)H-hydrate epimerase [Pantoea sp. Brub]